MIAATPRFLPAHSNLADLLRNPGALEKALSHYAQAVPTGPPNPRFHNGWSLALLMSGRAKDAIVQFEKAIELAPSYSEAQSNLRRARVSAGEGKK